MRVVSGVRPAAAAPFGLWSALDTQLKVVGALIMRELHTRFGRDNIGYLWVIVEPMLLALTVTGLHMGSIGRTQFGMDPAPFWITGYTSFVMFRSIVLRAESALESNRSLLYHRVVTITDMLLARTILEGAGTGLAIFLLLGAAHAVGIGNLPDRPLLLLEGLVLLLWFSFALSLLVCAGCEVSPVVARLTHPTVYVMLPISGVFFLLTWVPDPYRSWLLWFPLTHIFDLIREGQFRVYDSAYIDVPYVVGSCMIMTLAGLGSVRAVRRRLHLE